MITRDLDMKMGMTLWQSNMAIQNPPIYSIYIYIYTHYIFPLNVVNL